MNGPARVETRTAARYAREGAYSWENEYHRRVGQRSAGFASVPWQPYVPLGAPPELDTSQLVMRSLGRRPVVKAAVAHADRTAFQKALLRDPPPPRPVTPESSEADRPRTLGQDDSNRGRERRRLEDNGYERLREGIKEADRRTRRVTTAGVPLHRLTAMLSREPGIGERFNETRYAADSTARMRAAATQDARERGAALESRDGRQAPSEATTPSSTMYITGTTASSSSFAQPRPLAISHAQALDATARVGAFVQARSTPTTKEATTLPPPQRQTDPSNRVQSLRYGFDRVAQSSRSHIDTLLTARHQNRIAHWETTQSALDTVCVAKRVSADSQSDLSNIRRTAQSLRQSQLNRETKKKKVYDWYFILMEYVNQERKKRKLSTAEEVLIRKLRREAAKGTVLTEDTLSTHIKGLGVTGEGESARALIEFIALHILSNEHFLSSDTLPKWFRARQ